MLFYFAPMEGVTNYIFRNTYSKYYQSIDKYFSPFINATVKGNLGPKVKRDLAIENNKGINLIPQLLTNRSEDFNKSAIKLKKLGYNEINLNLGCPSGTVAPKGKGSGQLRDLEKLQKFLDEIFSTRETEISVKTRLGFVSPDEIHNLLPIFNNYPIKELTVHSRVREDYYKGKVNLNAFRYVVENSINPVCYNGDLNTVEDIKKFTELFPTIDRIMLGRGLVANPGLIDEYKTGKKDSKSFKDFHDSLFKNYEGILFGDRNITFKMKEYWALWANNYPDNKKGIKKIMKAQTLKAYFNAVNSLLER